MSVLTPKALAGMSLDQLDKLEGEILSWEKEDRKENALLYYQPVSDRAKAIHACTAKTVGIFGGNRSGKTTTPLVEAVCLATGTMPPSLADCQPFLGKFRGPIQIRIVCESITTTLHQVMLRKLKWWVWNGFGRPGSMQGHYGWVPKDCLIDGSWESSWSEKLRTLRLLYRDPEKRSVIEGESSIQFMCLRGDQRILMHSGEWMPVASIVKGQKVIAPDGTATNVKNVFQYGASPLYKIRTKGGREIIATPNHQHFMSDGSLKRTDELCAKDCLKVFVDEKRDGFDDPMPQWQLGWLGILLGDGYIKHRQARFTAIEGSRVLADLPPLPPDTKLMHYGKDHIITLIGRRNYNPLVQFVKRMGLWGKGSATKFVPSCIFRQPPNEIAYFVRHIWNCDGSVNRDGRGAAYTTISRQLAYDMKYLLWRIGVHAAIVEGFVKCGFTGKQVYRYIVQVWGGSFDRFMNAIQGNDFSSIEIHPRGLHGQIKLIERVADEPCYCIEVDHPSNGFICDGLVTHNSKDQDVSDHASGEFHLIIMDEPPSYAIFQESVARVMSLGGRLFVDMTWPSDPAFPCEWLFDEIYDKGQPGPNKDPNIDCFNLYTTENPNVDQAEIHLRASQMSDTEKQVRIYGQPIRFSNRIHPLFTDQAQTWCFFCGKVVLVEAGRCLACQGTEVVSFCHVAAFEYNPTWPVICLLDPHPRKPHMLAYWAVDPHDDLWCIGELEVSESPLEVKRRCDDFESEHHVLITQRWMDPNMGRSPSGTTREITWQDEFGAVGLEFDLADDSEVGRSRVNEYLKPSPATQRPRMIWHPRCTTGIIQFKRFVWDDYRKSEERDQKQRPKPKHDDFPALARYLLNTEPCFRYLKGGYGAVKMCQDGPGRGGY